MTIINTCDNSKIHIDVHVHPFLGKNSILDVIQAMYLQNLDIIAMEALDASLYPLIVKETKKLDLINFQDDSGIKLKHKGQFNNPNCDSSSNNQNPKYFLNAREYNTKEGIHIITIGYSLDSANNNTLIREIIDSGLKNEALVILDHPFVDNHKSRTAGHISEKLENKLESLCKEYSGEIALEWNAYCVPWIRYGLKIGLNSFKSLNSRLGFDNLDLDKIVYHDVNNKVEELSENLEKEGYNLPIIADTDLHARSKNDLDYVGTSRIISKLEGETPKEILKSLKNNIFSGNYENVKQYVPLSHLLKCFCFPIIAPYIFKNPRAENN